MTRSALALLVSGLLPVVACQSAVDENTRLIREDVRLVAEAITTQAVVPRNATFESLLRQQQVGPEMAASVVDAVRGVFNPRHLRADQSYWVTHTIDGLFREFRYQINPDELLRVVFQTGTGSQHASTPSFNVEVVKLPKEYARAAVSAQITPETSSLIGAFKAHGENLLLPLQLAEIFSGEVDFNSDLQQGDRFHVLFDRAVRNGEFVGYGDVLAAEIETGGRRLTAYRFAGADGKPGWYDQEGRSLRRAFLKTPLPFDPRVTSGFSYNRFHPVHGTRRPHLGVDFGAPTGTRVLAVAGGVVTTAAWSGEAGRLVRIKHAGGYETLYLHLNGFGPGIRAGARVDQGQTIGYVGMTGTATGPHLDYRVVKDGRYLNPMNAFSGMPAGEPLSPEQMADFVRMRDDARSQIAARLVTPATSAD
jgi:murein DD-endopeptidase MepM/ murein hydrolase activator NlpD